MSQTTSLLGLSSSLIFILLAGACNGNGGQGSADAGNQMSSGGSGGGSGNMVTLATSPDPQFLVVDSKNVYWTDSGDGSTGGTGTGTVRLSVPITGGTVDDARYGAGFTEAGSPWTTPTSTGSTSLAC